MATQCGIRVKALLSKPSMSKTIIIDSAIYPKIKCPISVINLKFYPLPKQGRPLDFYRVGKDPSPSPKGRRPEGLLTTTSGAGVRGRSPQENFWLPHPKFVGWGRILDPLYWKEQALKFSQEHCSALLIHTDIHTHTHRERERERKTS